MVCVSKCTIMYMYTYMYLGFLLGGEARRAICHTPHLPLPQKLFTTFLKEKAGSYSSY